MILTYFTYNVKIIHFSIEAINMKKNSPSGVLNRYCFARWVLQSILFIL